jgi:hypothetical protein
MFYHWKAGENLFLTAYFHLQISSNEENRPNCVCYLSPLQSSEKETYKFSTESSQLFAESFE